jgi:hypothetical protein
MADSTLIPKRMANIAPSDTVDLGATMGLYIGAAGTIVTQDVKGNNTTWIIPAAGKTIDGEFHKLLLTGNTVPVVTGNFVALYPN